METYIVTAGWKHEGFDIRFASPDAEAARKFYDDLVTLAKSWSPAHLMNTPAEAVDFISLSRWNGSEELDLNDWFRE